MFGFPTGASLRITLTTDQNSVDHFSKRTKNTKYSDMYSSTLSTFDFRSFHFPFRNSFQLSLTLLVHCRSQGVFRVGGEFPHVHKHNPVPVTQEILHNLIFIILQDYHSLRLGFPALLYEQPKGS